MARIIDHGEWAEVVNEAGARLFAAGSVASAQRIWAQDGAELGRPDLVSSDPLPVEGGPCVRTVIASAIGRTGATHSLVHRSAGWEVAGSGTRDASEGWGSLYEMRDGSKGGQWFAAEAEARAHYLARVPAETDPVKTLESFNLAICAVTGAGRGHDTTDEARAAYAAELARRADEGRTLVAACRQVDGKARHFVDGIAAAIERACEAARESARYSIETSPQIHVADVQARTIAAGPFRAMAEAAAALAELEKRPSGAAPARVFVTLPSMGADQDAANGYSAGSIGALVDESEHALIIDFGNGRPPVLFTPGAAEPVPAPRTVHVHGQPVILTSETIIATRQWFADNARQCIADAREGRTRVNDLASYVAWREESIAASLRGDGDGTFAFLQRAVALQTGECVPLLAHGGADERPCAAEGLTSYRYPSPYGFVMIGARDHADALREAARSIGANPHLNKLEIWDATAKRYAPAR